MMLKIDLFKIFAYIGSLLTQLSLRNKKGFLGVSIIKKSGILRLLKSFETKNTIKGCVTPNHC